MGYETEHSQQVLLKLKAVDADIVPVPGEAPVLFADTSADDGGLSSVTAKLPDGRTVALGAQYMADAKALGVKGDAVQTTATIAAAASTATVASALSQADVGKTISIEAAGDGADLITTITAVSSDGLTVTVADAATDGGTDAVTFVGTPDEAALGAADPGASGTLLIPPGMYLIADDLTLDAGTLVVMRGASFVVLEGFTLEITGYIQAAPDQLPAIADADGNGTFTHTYTEGFYATAPVAKPTVANAASADIIAALETLGLIIDGT